MKKFVLVPLLIICIGFVASAQKLAKKNVPAKVQEAFTKLYPKITDEKWEKENNSYEAEFTLNNNKTSVTIDEKGNLMETETEITSSLLPAAAMSYFNKNYPGEKIKEAAKIVDNKGVVTYEIGLKKTDLLFDDKGNFVKKTK